MADTFEPGDVVVLKSGGPTMTVNAIGDDGVECIWFLKDQQQYGSFPAATLQKYRTPTVGGGVVRG